MNKVFYLFRTNTQEWDCQGQMVKFIFNIISDCLTFFRVTRALYIQINKIGDFPVALFPFPSLVLFFCQFSFQQFQGMCKIVLEKAMAPHSSTFAWKIPWTEEPGRLQSMGSLESDTTEQLHFHFSLSCIGEGNGNPLQLFLPGESQGRGSLVGFRLWGHTELDTTEVTQQQQQQQDCVVVFNHGLILHLPHGLFRNVLFNFQVSGDFPYNLKKLISTLISLRQRYALISLILSRFIMLSSIIVNTPFTLKRIIVSAILDREGNGTPLQYSCLENPMDGGAWKAAVHGVTESGTQLSDFTFTFHIHASEKEMATHSGVPAWRIPEQGEPGGLPSIGSHRVGPH